MDHSTWQPFIIPSSAVAFDTLIWLKWQTQEVQVSHAHVRRQKSGLRNIHNLKGYLFCLLDPGNHNTSLMWPTQEIATEPTDGRGQTNNSAAENSNTNAGDLFRKGGRGKRREDKYESVRGRINKREKVRRNR